MEIKSKKKSKPNFFSHWKRYKSLNCSEKYTYLNPLL